MTNDGEQKKNDKDKTSEAHPESILLHHNFDAADVNDLIKAQDVATAKKDMAADAARSKEASLPMTTRPLSFRSRYQEQNTRQYDASEQTHAWLVSFTDVMALMLAFYVMIFSMNVPSSDGWTDVAGALQKEFNKYYGASNFRGLQDEISLRKREQKDALDLSYLKTVLLDFKMKNQSLKDTKLLTYDHYIVMQVPDEILFEKDSLQVNKANEQTALDLAEMLSRLRNKIEIQAYAAYSEQDNEDNRRASWELSLNRAAEVAAILKNVGYTKNVTIRGQAYSRDKNVESPPSNAPSERQRHQMLEIVIMAHGDDGDKVFAGSEAD